jgi:hypothetical protein
METTPNEMTEDIRRELLLEINADPGERPVLECRHGQVWSAAEMATDFEVLGFAAPFAVVKRKTDNQLGSLLFQHHPRFYFAYQQDK